MIPTVPGSDVDFSTPSRGARIDEGSMEAPARATLSAIDANFRGKRAVSGAIQDLGDEFGRLSADMEKVNRAKIAADVDFRMRAAQQSFLESIRGDQNEKDWAERANGVYDDVRDQVYEAHAVPPGMRPEIDSSLRSWGQALAIKTQTMAGVQAVNRAEVAIRKSYDEAGRDGDAQGMANAVKLGRSSKLDPVAMDELQGNIPRALALTAIENGIRANPQGTHDLLVSGGSLPVADEAGRPIVPSKVFPQKELASLVVAARTQAAAWQKANAEDLLQTSADPITGMVPDDAIKAKMASKEVTEAFGRSLMAAQDRKVKAETAAASREAAKFDRDAFNLVSTKIHDPTAWGVNPEEYARSLIDGAAEISDPALRARAINDANRQLAAVKKTGEVAERPVERAMFEMMNRDLAEQSAMVPIAVADVPAQSHWFKANEPAATLYTPIFGGLNALKKEAFDMSVFGVDAENAASKKEEVVRAAELHAAKLQEDMRLWFKSPEGQKATFEQANEHRQSLERPYVMESVRATLSKRVPVEISTKEGYDVLPSGARYIRNGIEKIKP